MLSKSILSPYAKFLGGFKIDEQGQAAFLLFFRVMVAIIAIIEVASISVDLPLIFSSSVKLAPQELFYLTSSYFEYLHPFYTLLEDIGVKESFISSVTIVYPVALVFVLLGLFTRTAAIVALVLQLIIFRSFALLNYGYDHFITMSLFYCVLFPTGRYYSLDTYLFNSSKQFRFNYRLVLQLHLCIVYFYSGLAKALDPGWWNGTSILKAIASVDNPFYVVPPLLLLLLGVSTVLIEFLYPFLIWHRVTSRYTLIGIILMHLGIAIVMSLPSFATIMIVWNIAAFGSIRLKTKTLHEVAA